MLIYILRRPTDGFTLQPRFTNPINAFRWRYTFPDRWDWSIIEQQTKETRR